MFFKKCIHPFTGREMVVVADDFVDREFGTGAVKITPAHDPNDYEVGIRHNLPMVNILTDNGEMNESCGKFAGLKRFDARKKVAEELEKMGLLKETLNNPMVVPMCRLVHKFDVNSTLSCFSRSKDIIEPIVKAQWYIKCDNMAKRALDVVENGELKLIPETHNIVWKRWLEDSR